jgi:ATP-binding cassette subfamily B protein
LIHREFTVANAYPYNLETPLKWILSHIRQYSLLPLLAMLGTIIAEGLFSVSVILVGQAFDVVVQGGPIENLTSIALAIFVAHVIQGTASLGGGFAIEILAQRVERDAREELYISLIGKSQTFHNKQRVGDIMARATNDVQQLKSMINPGASLIMDTLMSIVAPIVAITFLHPPLLLVPVIFVVTFVFAVRNYNKQLTPVTGALRRQFGMLNARLAEAVSGIEVVKSYAQEPREQALFTQNVTKYRDVFVKEGGIKARYLPLLLYGITYGVAFGHALWLFMQGSITPGEVVAFMGLVSLLRFPTFISLFSFSLVQLGLAGANRILDLINTESELDENLGGISQQIIGDIAFEDVAFGYASTPILKNISFYAKPGQTIAIVGQTGSGKTTMTRLVNRIYDVSAGRVLIDGIDVREWNMDSLRSQISTIEQDIFLFSRTIGQNIAFGAPADVTQDQIEQAARDAQAHDFIMQFPNGYDTMVGERGVTLSGGQRQRIAIARAFLTNPRILILDDSTSAIDSATEDEIQQAMRRILQGRTTLLITPRLSQIRWADHILVLRRGELVAQGRHEQLLQESEPYQRIFARYDK